jgi:signal transduction histidine kinase
MLLWFADLAHLAAQTTLPPLAQDLQVITNARQLSALNPQDASHGYPIQLVGMVTFLDTNRSLIVLQDATGALAINLPPTQPLPRPGELVRFESPEALPCVTVFPDYPFRPSGSDIQQSFEAPENWGDYHLQRMRGFVHPPVTGEYTFWIASDNSSELWLSPDRDPGKVKKLAFVAPGNWADSRDWSAFPSQRSESVSLKAGETYYIEAFQEQMTLNDNLAVAWQGPGIDRAVIDAAYLSPWLEGRGRQGIGQAKGILREYWTNYTAGNLIRLTGPSLFNSQATVKETRVTVLETNRWPEPRRITPEQPLTPEENFRWVEFDGYVTFAAKNGDAAIFDLTDGIGRTQVRAADWSGRPAPARSSKIQVRGVCEGLHRESSGWMPDLIWAPTASDISVVESSPTNSDLISASRQIAPARPTPTLGGYFIAHGVVTFNDLVFNQDCLFIQDANGGVFILQDSRKWGKNLRVGQYVEIGGDLVPGPYAPSLRPVQASILGWQALPDPVIEPVTQMASGTGGHWTEIQGVARSVDTNNILTVAAEGGPVAVWVGQTTMRSSTDYVDSSLRLRGVLSLRAPVRPLLLVPSPEFVEVEEPAPKHPFASAAKPIASFAPADGEGPRVHRVKVAGVITYTNDDFFFLQDATGGLRVQPRDKYSLAPGDCVEALGFPAAVGSVPALTEAVVRPTGTNSSLEPRPLDVSDLGGSARGGSLVRLKVTLLSVQARRAGGALEVQQGHRVFDAVLARSGESLPKLSPGSLLEITGICEVRLADSPAADMAGTENPRIAALRILLRSPRDVVLLKGPPWWTWKGVAVLIAALLTVLFAALLGIHLLRLRLARQQAARLEFSRQILESQEGERRRIAVNLHDSLGQNLLVIMNQARRAMQPAPDDSALQQRLDEISTAASQAIEEVRQITHDLRPYQLDRLGLTQALRALLNRVAESSSTLFASHVDDIDGLFDKESEIHIYRIVQEALNNVIKHSGATESTVVVKRDGPSVSISIRDNGCGFDAGSWRSGNSQLRQTGMGLNGITERASILEGKLTIESLPGQGTTLEFQLSGKLNENRHQTADRG